MSDLFDTPLLRTKLEPAHPMPGVIERPRLAAARQLARAARVVSIVAPAGFGKSTLAAQWCRAWRSEGVRCAWLALDSDDDEPNRFMLYACLALNEADPGLGEQAVTLLVGQGVAAPRAIASMLVNDLQRRPGEFFLFLDDYHVISDSAVQDFVHFIVSHAPPGFRLVLTSRLPVPLPLAQLYARGECLDVGAADLRFDEDEAASFLATLPYWERSALAVRPLLERTEGWPAAVRIASLDRSLSAAEADGAVDARGAAASRTMERLIEAVIDGLPPALQRFLAATSILDGMNAGLCAAVTGEPQAAEHFEQMRHSGLLVQAIDPEGDWLRHHALLRTYLAGPLVERLGIPTAPLHRRAAEWFAERSRWIEAVRHGIAAGESKKVGEWLSQCAMALVQKGDLLTLMTWTRWLPAAMLRDRAGVQLAIAWALALAMRFEDAERELELLEARVRTHPDETYRRHVLSHVLVVRIVKSGLQDDDEAVSRQLSEWEGPQSVDRWAANSASSTRRWLCWRTGDWVGVYAQPWQKPDSAADLRDVFTEVYREMLLGSVELDRGRLDVAEIHVRRALESAARAGGSAGLQTAVPTPILAAIHYERGLLDEAQNALVPWLGLIEHGVMLQGVAHTYLCLARVAYARDPGGDLAYRHLEHAEALGQARGWDRLVTGMLLQRVDWLARDGRPEEAQACLERIRTLSSGISLLPRRPRSELVVHRDWANALLLLRTGDAGRARRLLGALLEAEKAFGNTLRCVRLGVALAHACDAEGDRDGADRVLHDALTTAEGVGSVRGVLDHGPEAATLARRLVGRRDCGRNIDRFVERLTGDSENVVPVTVGQAPALTDREVRVLELVGRGMPNKQVARELGVSSETVKTHLSRVFAKLEVGDRARAVSVARAFHLLPPAP